MHHQNIAKARVVLTKVRTFYRSRQVIAYLKKINAYVMEELVLTSLEDQGYSVKRSPTYSGDGGKDGETVIFGKRYFIQTKRYAEHISKGDIQKFIILCNKHNVRGLFVHTGKTGRHSKREAEKATHIHIISGDNLVRLVRGQYFGINRSIPYILRSIFMGMVGKRK